MDDQGRHPVPRPDADEGSQGHGRKGPRRADAADHRGEIALEYSTSLVIAASPASVIDAFFDPNALAVWWQVTRSVCIPKPLGSYAVEWDPTEWRDEVLGRLGGAFHATVMEYKPGREFFLADSWWLPPDGDPIGPMAVEATCSPQSGNTLLHIRQSGYEEGARWKRYYEIISPGWERALQSMKDYLEIGRLEP